MMSRYSRYTDPSSEMVAVTPVRTFGGVQLHLASKVNSRETLSEANGSLVQTLLAVCPQVVSLRYDFLTIFVP